MNGSRAILVPDTALQLWDRVRTSLWFVPGLMALGAAVLAGLAPAVDGAVSDDLLRRAPFVFSGSPVAARAVLTTIATSMITIAGVVFSMTIVALQLASSQFGPRLLRTFLRDRGNQLVLGAFVAIFLYCILLLPRVDAQEESPFIPHISVTLAVIGALVGLGMLVYFIDHVAQSIHADAIILSVSRELEGVIDELFPESIGAQQPDGEVAPPQAAPALVRASSDGYVRFINGDALLRIAAEADLMVRLEVAPGGYVVHGDVLAHVWPEDSTKEDAVDAIRRGILIGSHRTTLQDVTFAFEQLTEMALRALSPGINDPNTAGHCVDRIGSGLARMVGRPIPSRVRHDEAGAARVIAEPTSLEQVLRSTAEPIARNASVHLPVWLRLMIALQGAHARARREADRVLLGETAARVAEAARTRFESEVDQSRIMAASAWAAHPLSGRPGRNGR
ncbi:MAG: DUF2254 domain-containing protein [Phycisphaerales bacterium JB039]